MWFLKKNKTDCPYVAGSSPKVKIGLVLGEGLLPDILLQECHATNTDAICALLGNKPNNIQYAKTVKNFKVTQIPEIIKFFKESGVARICIAGYVKKPKLDKSLFKFNNVPLLWKILRLPNKGDNFLLSAILSYIEGKGFGVISASDFVPSILTKRGVLTKTKPSKDDEKAIVLGMNFLKDISKYDVSQACIVENNCITAIEGSEGTERMITRMGEFSKKGSILVKTPKQGQTLKIDMPTIGVDTIQQCLQNGIKGVAIKAEETIFLNSSDAIKTADENGIFVVGL